MSERFADFDSLIAANARQHPTRTAIESPDQGKRITFGELDRVTNRLAHFLRARGIAKGDRVSVIADNSIEALILFWGVIRSGAVVNPINLEIREKHVRQILDHVRPKLVAWSREIVTDPAALGEPDDSWMSFGEWDAGERPPGDLFAAMAASPDTPRPGPPPGPEDWVCINYTSGTTDAPKGVMWRQQDYYAMNETTIDRLEITAADTVLDYRHFSWSSPQVLSIGPTMQTGARLVLARRFSQARFFEWLQRYEVTVAVGIPTVINMLLSRPVAVKKDDLPHLRFMTSSTAPLSMEKHTEFERVYGIPIVQLAGGTETGFMAGNHPGRRKLGSIGRPTLNITLRILDDGGNECPPEQEGEMVVSGRQLASAYLTGVDTVVPIARDGFRTGDLARRDADGYVYITGRRKDIIIKGGVNIAALEITNALLEHPAAAEAATIGVPDDIYGEAVVSFVAPRPGTTPTETDLLAHCRARLTEFKVPRAIVVVDAIPKNANAKVAKDALAALWGRTAGR